MARTQALTTILPAALAAALLTGCDDKMFSRLDNTPPTASIVSPTDGAGVSGAAFRVDVDAQDDMTVAEVRFRVNGVLVDTDAEEPWSTTLVTLDQAEGGTLDLDVEAVDASGNTATVSASYTINARTLTQLTNNPLADENPAWSPDGSRIAFQSQNGSTQYDLWVMDADGQNPAALTQDVNEDRNPAWSPDGTMIAFDSDRAGTFDIWLLPLAGGEPAATPLTFGNLDDVQPAWSPGGTLVYFASDRGVGTSFNVWRQPATGGGLAVQVTAFAEDDTAPALSGDGARLAFASRLNFSTDHIYTMFVGDVNVAPLTGDTGFTEADPAWLPGSRTVFFTRDDGVDSNLWFQAPGDEAVPVQATFGSGSLGDGGAAWSPDGTRLAFHSDRTGNLEIYVIE
ncbi:MAG TPA: Ig-like domain-containing protein [bacterium]|nr:Ig-like domain-containing protein [bacterium]